ncbi:MAG: PH domain-containing protein [Verrucomicrobiota bacterium]|nr:PH domain-containing protein [Limisphaera sp.]MDW8380911.1 PH domain-containing protein [Verrucomicrobiota bacterium]
MTHGPLHNQARTFGAPWGRSNKIFTWLLTAWMGLLPALVARVPEPRSRLWAWVGVGLVWLILGAVALFCVRAYALREGALWIRRSFWWTRIPLAGLISARVEPQPFRGAIRLWGCAGFMAYLGWYSSKRLGRFRAWVTDPSRGVILEFADRTIVVSPDDPEAFVRALGFERGSNHTLR